jgi:Arc/MetJ-type ribon-helix-helix transcriptional regulator
LRLPPELTKAIEAWAAQQDDEPNRSEAIRRLVELGLSSSTSPKRPRVLSTAKEGASRAAELAADVIGDQMPSTSEEEKATRRRRLIKGPSEFQNVRRDRP